MKFIHKISKITSYIIQICLPIFALASNSLWGEVYRAGQIYLSSKGEHHISFTKVLKNSDNQYFKAKRFFEKANAIQMPGYGIFIPKGKHNGLVYIARKHELSDYKGGHNQHNPKSGGHPFNTGFYDHTERQLALYLGAEALNVNIRPQKKIPEQTEEKIHRQAKALRDLLKLTPKGEILTPANVKGEFHIYTKGSPCVADIDSNNNFSCIKYYKILQQMFPNCTFHIYFSEPFMHRDLDEADANKLIAKIIQMVNTKKNPDIENYFTVDSNRLKYKGTDTNSIEHMEDRNKRYRFIKTVTKMMNTTLTPKEVETLFNEVFNITNFHYHMVTSVPTNDSSIGRDTYNKDYNKGMKRKSNQTGNTNKRPKIQ